MHTKLDRRQFLRVGLSAAAAGSLGVSGSVAAAATRDFKISVAGWSFHREVSEGRMTQLELFGMTRDEYDIEAFELVNTMLEVPHARYVGQLLAAAQQQDMVIPLIMIDAEGNIGDPEPEARAKAVRNCFKWVYIAQDLGCHSIRVNWRGEESGTPQDPHKAEAFIARSVDAYRRLADHCGEHGINLLIENHFGPSSYPDMLMDLMKRVDRANFGTLPDFGNFPDDVDIYEAVDRMMPFAQSVSAKCLDFGPDGQETKVDFDRMLRICVDQHGYHGYIGIEYGGARLGEREGVRACYDLLVKLRG